MPQYDEKHVKICGGLVVWDGITRPETLDDNSGQKWNVKLVIPPTSPDVSLFDQLARAELMNSEYKGALPNGGLWPISPTKPGEFGGGFDNWAVINCTTYKSPDVYDENGQLLQPMQYGQLMYPGQRIDVLVHCKAYNNKSKGIACCCAGGCWP